jgi:hypothetical protein
MTKHLYKRTKKLIKPGLQLRLTATFLATALLCFLLQLLIFGQSLADLAARLPSGNADVLEAAPGMLARVLVLSLVSLTPLVAIVGVLMTFRVAGPVYRFERFLTAVARGEQIEECRIRKGDELRELCALINAATSAARDLNGAQAEPSDANAVDAEDAEDDRRAA